MPAQELLTDSRVLDIVRVMPENQQREIDHYKQLFETATNNIDFGMGFVERGRYASFDGKRIGLIKTVVVPAVNTMAWNDLTIADRYGFAEPTPATTFRIGQIATLQADYFAKTKLASVNPADPAEYLAVAQGLVGLHTSLIGSTEAIDDDIAQKSLYTVAHQIGEKYLRALDMHIVAGVR